MICSNRGKLSKIKEVYSLSTTWDILSHILWEECLDLSLYVKGRNYKYVYNPVF